MNRIDHLAERFCAAPVPTNECADPCASMQNYPYQRTGTNFLSLAGAKAVLKHVLDGELCVWTKNEDGVWFSASRPKEGATPSISSAADPRTTASSSAPTAANPSLPPPPSSGCSERNPYGIR